MKIFKFKSFLSPLSLGEGSGVRPLGLFLLASLFLACLFLASCSQEVASPAGGIGDGKTVEVTKEIQVSVLPMQTLGAATRAGEDKPEKREAVHLSFGSDAATRVQTGTSDKTAAEQTIKNAYIVQFDGTAPTSTIKVVKSITSTELSSGSAITATFSMTAGVKNRVYVIANRASAPTIGTTLSTFEAPIAYTVSTGLPSIGGTSCLPMSACQDVGVGDTFDVFQLKSVLAKLTFKTSAGTLKLMNVPNGYSFNTRSEPGDAPVRPAGTTYTTTATLTSGTTYYVPENLGGRNDLLMKHYTRCAGFAPANAMYVEITNSGTKYNLYLGDGSASDFNFAGNYAYDINATIYGTDTYDLRVGNTLPVGTAIKDLNIDGQTANCYIATSANTWYMFNNTVMGNGATTPVPANLMSGTVAAPIVPSKLSPVNADVLWETLNTTTAPAKGDVVTVYPLKDKILFKTGAKEGNAVIAALDASNNIIWSWHIWRLNTDPTASTFTFPAYTSTSGTFDDTGTTSHAGLTMMTYNLGALSNTAKNNLSTGLHYQWGRKDPFPGYAGLSSPDNVVMGTVPSGVPVIPGSTAQYTVAQSVASPTIFFKYGGDWTSRNDNLWGTAMTGTVTIGSMYNSNIGSKSIYDPCPVGWRVPPGYVYAILSTSTFGWDTSGRSYTSVWFPASGYRSNSNGSLGGIGANGNYWASPPVATNTYGGSYLFFSSSNVYPYNDGSSSSRAYGYCVRCSRE